MTKYAIGIFALLLVLTVGGFVAVGVLVTPPDKVIDKPTVPTEASGGQVNLSRKTIYRLKVKKDSLVLIFDEIGENSFAIANKINAMSTNIDPTVVLINSPGGSVLDGAQIISAIEASHTPVYTVCMELCASMAAHIHNSGKKRLMLDRSILMHHPASGGVSGNFNQIHNRFGLFDRYTKKMGAMVAYRAGITLDKFLEMSQNELWLDAEDAVNQKFADGLVSLDLSELNLPEVNATGKLSSALIAKKLGVKMSDF